MWAGRDTSTIATIVTACDFLTKMPRFPIVRTPQPSLLRRPDTVVEFHPSPTVHWFVNPSCPIPGYPFMPVDHPSLARIFRNQTAWLLALAGEQQAIWQGGDISACVTPGHGHLLVPAGANVSPDDLDAAFAWLGQSGISPLLIWSDRDDPALERNIRGRGGGDSW